MAIIPLKQQVVVRKSIKTVVDGWTTEVLGPPEVYKVRAVEQINIIESNSSAGGTRKTTDENYKSTLTVYFNKFPDIDYDTRITFTNEVGTVIDKTPIKIKPVRMVNGKPTLTKVFL